jgi:transcriptional regulator with XRE-family HTH domain
VARSHPGDEAEGNDPVSREMRISFGRGLRAARRAAGLTQTQFAERVGISQSYVSAVERGVRNLTLEVMAGLAAALGYKVTVTVDREARLENDNPA